MYIFFCILIVFACVLLIGAVLIQKSKGGGLASDYSSGNQYLGYRKTTDFIEKATWTLAIFICVCSIFASFAVKTPINKSAMTPETTQAPANTAGAPVSGDTKNSVPAANQSAPSTQAAPAQDNQAQ